MGIPNENLSNDTPNVLQEGCTKTRMDTDAPLLTSGDEITRNDMEIIPNPKVPNVEVKTVKEPLFEGIGKGGALSLGVQQKVLKKNVLEKNSKLGRKKDKEKVKLTGENLVEYDSVKTLDSHFNTSQK